MNAERSKASTARGATWPKKSVTVRPGPVSGTVKAPPSKSHTHRAFLLGAQSEEPCTVTEPLWADDTRATLSALHALGAHVELRERDAAFHPARLRAPNGVLDCRNSGTTLRLLTALAARLGTPVHLDGDASLRRRPNGPLLAALGSLGARTRSRDGACPITVHGPLRSGPAALPGTSSSQYASALLLNLPLLDGASTLALQAPVRSAPYLDLSVQVARHFGLHVEEERRGAARTYRMPGGDTPRAEGVQVEGDWSSAAFCLSAAAVTGGTATVTGLLRDSMQADRAVLPLLRAFGARVEQQEDAATVTGGELTAPGEPLDVGACPDLFPALSVVAACTRGATRIGGAPQLRHKESDRIRAMAQSLDALGVRCEEHPDGLTVHGGRIRGGSVHAHGDHRVHMALCVAALAAEGPVTVDGADTPGVSHPGFHEHLRALGVEVGP